MTDHFDEPKALDFSALQAILTSESVEAHASELHGVLTGLICAGFALEDKSYIAMLNDLFNQGDHFPSPVKLALTQLYHEIWGSVLDDAYGFNLLLPDDDDSISERGNALGVWVQGFNLGFGLQQKDSPVLSAEVKEVLADFSEIANLSDEMEEDEATEQAYFEISEYVRISALLCFSELATLPSSGAKNAPKDNTTENKTLH